MLRNPRRLKDQDEQKRRRLSRRINAYAEYSGIAFQMIAIIGLGTFGGVKLDQAFPNTYSLFTILCTFAAVCLSMYFVIRQAQKISNKKRD